MRVAQLRNTRPASEDALWNWVYAFTGVKVARRPVCRGHHSPWDAFRTWHFERPGMALLLGPRGGGKSFLSALDTHLKCRWNLGYSTRILGGSLAQSKQIYEALRRAVWHGHGPLGSDRDMIASLLKHAARYANGSEVQILATSSTSVRGPHVPSLKLDEVDEIDPDHRESAMGMCVADRARGHAAQVLLTSTWHRVGGPMAGLIDQGREGRFPFHQFCIFEVLERCPDERSGPELEKCPECPLVAWCHSDRDQHPSGLPKAKRSAGHYAIDALIQKVQGTSARVFAADYLCVGPKADSLWFPGFAPERHVCDAAEYDPRLPVHLAVDSGVCTGAVWFQVATVPGAAGPRTVVRVFADYYAERVPAYQAARQILELTRARCNGRLDYRSTDPAGGAQNPIGPTVLAEYQRAGLHLDRWPVGSVADGLALLESFVEAADGSCGLLIHPRCVHLIRAFEGYVRKKVGTQWADEPADPQHPHEDLIDALRGGLRRQFPPGQRMADRPYATVPIRSILG